ncbi:MAG: hypothetical protein ACKN9U_10570, partial [Pirellulaceae bacterium]
VFGLLDASTSPTVDEKKEGSQPSSFAKISESPWHVVPSMFLVRPTIDVCPKVPDGIPAAGGLSCYGT